MFREITSYVREITRYFREITRYFREIRRYVYVNENAKKKNIVKKI